jgi:hypothetical protein
MTVTTVSQCFCSAILPESFAEARSWAALLSFVRPRSDKQSPPTAAGIVHSPAQWSRRQQVGTNSSSKELLGPAPHRSCPHSQRATRRLKIPILSDVFLRVRLSWSSGSTPKKAEPARASDRFCDFPIWRRRYSEPGMPSGLGPAFSFNAWVNS